MNATCLLVQHDVRLEQTDVVPDRQVYRAAQSITLNL